MGVESGGIRGEGDGNLILEIFCQSRAEIVIKSFIKVWISKLSRSG